jgi:flavorubredoxin
LDKRDVVGISHGVFWVGIKDRDRRLFDALIPLPEGTTYNAYLVVGDKKRALIDTVNPGFEKALEEKIKQITDPSELDYVIMNHAEPDHGGAIPHMMAVAENAKLVTSKVGARMAQTYYKVPENRTIAVAEGDTISLGDKTLRFIDAPMLHWPETMFTYLPENKILFPCDFFGSHITRGFYDNEVDDLVAQAQRYFGEIMMPYSNMAQKAVQKLKALEIDLIAPSHGPIYRNTQRILEAYDRWSNGETKHKATIVYVSMWKSTEKMVNAIAETLASEGIETAQYNLTSADTGDLARDLVDSMAIVLGAPTVLGGVHPLGLQATYLVKALHPPARFAVILSSYGWAGGAIKHIQETLGPSKMEIVGAIQVNGPPSEKDIARIVELGKTLASRMKEEREGTLEK